MRIVFTNYYYDAQQNDEEDLLEQYYTVVGWAEALQRAGAEVIVISRFSKESELTVNNVRYIFKRDNLGPQIMAWQIPVNFLNAVAALKPDVIHLHHLSLSLQTLYLRWKSGKKTAIVVQHHGGKMVHGWKMKLHNYIHRVADGFFFTTDEQGAWWFGKSKQRNKIMPVMEGGTFFNYDTRDAGRDNSYQPREKARQKTGMSGNPVLLWTGRLDENKDPLTVLQGLEIVFKNYPQASLYMIYHESDLLSEVQQTITRSLILKDRVHLLGKIPHKEIEPYYQSADLFILGSHYEGSGYALSEALRCGCVPIITRIPSFYMMTDEGKLGALWHPDDPQYLALAIKKVMKKQLTQEGKNCIDFFNKTLSFDAIAQQALQHYSTLLANK
jgi:glycosyltransferase involved in cell wall biosynthesis